MEKVKLDGIDKALDTIVKEYGSEVYEVVAEVIPEVAKDAQKQVKANAGKLFKKGKGSKHYANGWRVKVVKGRLGVETVVYNTNKPQLTHLLENGHAKANGIGRVSGRPHINPVNEWAEKEVVKRIEERLSK